MGRVCHSPFSHPLFSLSSLPLSSPFSIPFSSYSLIPPFQFFLLSHPYCLLLFFISLSTLPSSSPFPLPFSRYSLFPSFSPLVLFLFLPISFSILFACSHLISSHSLLSPSLRPFPPLFSLFPPPSFLFPSIPPYFPFSQSPPYSLPAPTSFSPLSSLPSQRPILLPFSLTLSYLFLPSLPPSPSSLPFSPFSTGLKSARYSSS